MTTARLLTVAVAATALLAACNREREPAAPRTDTPTPAVQPGSGTPTAYESKTPWAEVKLSLPAVIKTQPNLHSEIYTEEMRTLRQFIEGAQGERTEAGVPEDLPPYAKEITLTGAAETGALLSLKRVDYDYSGGAHPNTLTSGILWDKTDNRRLTPTDLFAKGANLTVLDQALCTALNTAKRARVPDSAAVTLGGSDWSCPRAADTQFVLTPGNTPGKAGGLTFLVGPYQIGPYAEGAYEIAVPLTMFRQLLAPAYAPEFAGLPVKTGDVTPTR